jgi:hypothetical protein
MDVAPATEISMTARWSGATLGDVTSQGAKADRLIGGKYWLSELLAAGGMGLVYAAVHQETGRAVAVKLLRSELMTHPDIVRRVTVEARLAVKASHPNVVEVLDAGTDEHGEPYLVLERLYGRPLEALLAEPLSLLSTTQVLVPVINALAMLHRVGILHRDIKPGNIFLHRAVDGRVTPKLLDFGIAKALARDGGAFTSAGLGTPAYMAPEQALGRQVGGPSADVWSMGVVFVRCLTGRLPFSDAGVGRDLLLRSSLRPEHLPGVPEDVAALLIRALAFEPSERPADLNEFRHELSRALYRTDGNAAWPDESSVSYPPSEFDLAKAVAVEPISAPALAAVACPRLVITRTLTGARANERHRGVSRPWRVPLVVALIGGVVAAQFFNHGTRGQRASEALLVAERKLPAVTSRSEGPAPAPPLGEPDPTRPSAVVPNTRPLADVTAHTSGERSPETQGARRRALSARRAGTPSQPMTRMGANRSPIIE